MKILCPIDFSVAANNAVEYAARFATMVNAELSVIHVNLAPDQQKSTASEEDQDEDSLEARVNLVEKLEAYSEEIVKSFGVICKPVILRKEGSLEKTLQNHLKDLEYDLIVMGTNGAEYANQLYFGTHTYHVIRKTTVPVLMVPLRCEFKAPRHIVYATNYQEYDAYAIRQLLQLTQVFEPHIDVLHISESESEVSSEEYDHVKNLMQKELADTRLSFHTGVEYDPAVGIDEFMLNQNRDMLVLLTKHYSVLEKIFHDSVSQELTFIADYPVLILHREGL